MVSGIRNGKGMKASHDQYVKGKNNGGNRGQGQVGFFNGSCSKNDKVNRCKESTDGNAKGFLSIGGGFTNDGEKYAERSFKGDGLDGAACNDHNGRPLVPQKEGGLSVVLDSYANEEVMHNVSVFSEYGLIGRFSGFWPSLSELHTWIFENWGPLLTGLVQIYPAAKGFFTVMFENTQDRKMVLCEHFWCWEEYDLMLKSWHPNFRSDSEGFDRIPIWVRLPFFPLHLWFNLCLEEIGNTLGDFLMVDECSSNLLHSTYARVLVEMNISKGLPIEIEIKTSNGC